MDLLTSPVHDYKVYRLTVITLIVSLFFSTHLLAADKICSSPGVYYCALSSIKDPASDSFNCDADPLKAIIPTVNSYPHPFVPASFSEDPSTTYYSWDLLYIAAPSGGERLKGITENRVYWERWIRSSPYGALSQSAQVKTFPCQACKEGEEFRQSLWSTGCLKRIIPDPEVPICPTPNPVDPISGAKIYNHIDYQGSGVYPINFTRSYRSLGHGWLYSYSQALNIVNDTSLIARRTDGNNIHFNKVNGVWLAAKQVAWTLTLDASSTSARYSLTHQNKTETYNADGWLTSVRKNGQGVDLNYAGDTLTVTDTNNQSLVLTLDFKGKPLGQGRADIPKLVSLQTPDGDIFKYKYNGSKLTHVQYPDNTPNVSGSNPFNEDNPFKTYLYEASNYVTGVIDESGQRMSTVTYDSYGRATSSSLANGANTYTFDYTYQNYGSDQRVTVTNSLGKQQVIHFDEANGSRVVSQIEGKATANCSAANKNFSYDARGLLVSKTDWNDNTTTYVRDAKGNVTSKTEAAGTPQQRLTTTVWHPTLNLPTKITEPDRVIDFSYDANGLLLERKETPVP